MTLSVLSSSNGNPFMLARSLSRLTIGLATGVALCFLLMVATVAASAVTSSPVSVPFVFSASVIEQSGLPAVEFVPNFWGLGLVVVLVTLAFLSAGFRKRAG